MVHTTVTGDATLFTLQQLHSTRRRLPNLLAGNVNHVPLGMLLCHLQTAA